ncbi:MAG: amidase domain-containing protein [Chloroflexota bacterium]
MLKHKHFTFLTVVIAITMLIFVNSAIHVSANTVEIIMPVPTTTSIPTTYTNGGVPSVEQLEDLKNTIQSYFETRYQALSVLHSDNFKENGFGDLVSDRSDARDFLDSELSKLTVEIRHAELNHLRYVDYKYSLEFNNIEVDNISRMVTVSLIEEHEVIEEISVELNPEYPFVSRRYNLEHTIILHEEQGKWKIISDNYTDHIWRMLRQSEVSTSEILSTMKAIPKPASQGESATSEFTCSNLPVNTTTHPYLRDDAVEYATSHINDYNPNYPDYNSGDDALPWGDCTNFVSQAIYEGGDASMAIPSILPQPSTDGQVGWYLLNGLQHASAWSDVNKLHEFIVDPISIPTAGWTEGPEGCDAGFFDLMLGDVIQYDWTGDGFWDHAVIVVDFVDSTPIVIVDKGI